MSTQVKYSNGTTYTLVPNSIGTEKAQDLGGQYHVPYTRIAGALRMGMGLQRITIGGTVETKAACAWDDIVAISFDSGTTWQTVYFSSVADVSDTWSPLYQFTLTLLAATLREGASNRFPSSGYAWGQSAQAGVLHHGGTGVAAICEIDYLAPDFYFPLGNSLADFAGRSLTLTRTLSKIHKGIAYPANIPIYDSGLVLSSETSQDVATWTPSTTTLRTVAMQIKQTAYPSNWVAGDGGAAGRNLLTANQSNAETDTTGMAAVAGTLTRDTSTPLAGAADFKVVATGGTMTLKTATIPAAVTAGRWYAGQALVKTSGCAAGRKCRLTIAWFTAGDVFISESASADIDAPTVATIMSVVGIAPATATKAYIYVYILDAVASETLYADSLMLEVLPTTAVIWTAALNKLTLDFANSLVKWTDDTTTVSATFPTAAYMAGTVVDIIVIDSTSHAVTVIAHAAAGTWYTATGTLAAVQYPALTLGNLEGSLASLVEWPYALVAAEYQDIDYSSAPLIFGTLYMSNQNAVTIQHTTDHRLLLPDGTDVSGLLGGTPVTATPTAATITCSGGMSARWFVIVKDTYTI